MRFTDEFRNRELIFKVAAQIRAECEKLQKLRLNSAETEDRTAAVTLMEVCGTHTMNIARFGLKSLLPDLVKLVSGPGCPVCVTSQRDIDSFLALGSIPGVILSSFGDMLRVPGTSTSLERLKASGTDVRIVYSPLDVIDIAAQNPGRNVIFFGVGFETTMPATALAVQSAHQAGLNNFSVFCVHKTMPAALRALFAAGNFEIDGLILPGHVTTIIGVQAYDFLPRKFGLACAVAGFEPLDILIGIESILRQIRIGAPIVANTYSRAVNFSANPKAVELLSEVFEPCDAEWRGIGLIPQSGVRLRERYSAFDAAIRFADLLRDVSAAESIGCRCGEVLRGALSPRNCSLFGSACNPSSPLGPCMVSSEGACAAEYTYGGA